MYAAAGFRPIPVRGKRPLEDGWNRRSSANPEVVREKFSRHTGNIGLHCAGELCVIDVDDEAQVEGLGQLPPTLTARTGSGRGFHYVYRLEPWMSATRIGDRTGIVPKVDIRCLGQIVVAPSVHPSGGRYRWIDVREPAMLPAALYERIVRPERAPAQERAATGGPGLTGTRRDTMLRRIRGVLREIGPAIDGQGGHRTTWNAVRAICGNGLSDDDEWALLLEWNETCLGPWTREELEHKMNDVKAKGEFTGLAERPRVEPIRPDVTVPDESWRQHLLYKQRKDGSAHLAPGGHNQIALLQHDPAWAGKIRLNEFTNQVELTDPPWVQFTTTPGTRPWEDTDAKLLQQWYQYAHDFEAGVPACHEAVSVVAREHRYHPIRDWFAGLTWDGTPRLDRWLTTYLGAAENEYTRRVGRWWLLSAVARAFEPGCKADHMLILEGAQGIGKSTALRVLAGAEWFNDTPLDLSSKDAYQALRGVWIVEFSELASMRRAEVEKVKAFASSPSDAYRASYERVVKKHPRQCVFAGTTNASQYLQDTTGNRRFWPVEAVSVDLAALARDRDQLWAEALDQYRSGAKWYPSDASEAECLRDEQEKRQISDDWEAPILSYLSGKTEVTTFDVLTNALGMTRDRLSPYDQRRCANVLATLGWTLERPRGADGRRLRVFRSSGPTVL